MRLYASPQCLHWFWFPCTFLFNLFQGVFFSPWVKQQYREVCTRSTPPLTFMLTNVFCRVFQVCFWSGLHSEFCKHLWFPTSGFHVQATWTLFTLYSVTLLAMEHPVLLGCFVSHRSENFLFSLFSNADIYCLQADFVIVIYKRRRTRGLFCVGWQSWQLFENIRDEGSGLLECYSVSTGK